MRSMPARPAASIFARSVPILLGNEEQKILHARAVERRRAIPVKSLTVQRRDAEAQGNAEFALADHVEEGEMSALAYGRASVRRAS